VRPANGSLREGERYRLNLSLRNANTSSGISSTFTRTLEFQVRPLMVMPFNVTVPAVTVLNGSPIAPFGADRFNFNSNDFTVSFGTVAGAVRYEIFARDLANPNFVFLASIDDNGAPRLSTSLPLPLAFDTVPGMSFPGTQPLAFNNTVTFAVAAVDVYGNRSPLMTAMTVNVTDQIPPTVTSGPTLVNDGTGAGSVDAINESSSPVTYRATIRYSEPMDVAMASLPSFTSMASNAPTITWAWDPTDTTLRSLVMTITIPPMGDATGSFLIRGGRDSSNNAIAQAGDIVGSLGGRRELLSNGNFQTNNMCNLSGWTPTNQGSAPAPVAVANNGAIAGSTSPCAALLGSPPGAQPSTGRARITQDITIPPTMMTAFQIEASARARPVFVYNRSAPGASYTMACRVETTGLPAMPLGTLSSAAAGGLTDVTNAPYSTGTTLFLSGGVSVRVICEADNATTFAANGAYYVDEVSVAQVRLGTL
jgi:hypothetical protein